MLADWIWSKTDCLKDTDFLVTVPGDPLRDAQRGLNPPFVLAEAVQQHLGVPQLLDALARTKSIRARELTYQDVRDSFSLGKGAQQLEQRSIVWWTTWQHGASR